MSRDDIEAGSLKAGVNDVASYRPASSLAYGTVVDTQLPARVVAGHVCRRRPHPDYREHDDCCTGFFAGVGMGIIFGLAVAGLFFLFLVYDFTHG